jgi:hypothetical protein
VKKKKSKYKEEEKLNLKLHGSVEVHQAVSFERRQKSLRKRKRKKT